MNDTTYLSCAETAKLIRAALKEAFSGVKFSVRSSVYSMGASITVGWTDGPNDAQVQAVVHRFAGATFDGMQDLKEYHSSNLNGQRVHFGADFIFTRREYTDQALAKAIKLTYARFMPDPLPDLPAAIAAYHTGALSRIPVAGATGWDHHWNLETQIRIALNKYSDRLSGAQSPTACAVA